MICFMTLALLIFSINLVSSDPVSKDLSVKLVTRTNPELAPIALLPLSENDRKHIAEYLYPSTTETELDGTIVYKIEPTAHIIRKPSGKYYLRRTARPGFSESMTPISRKQAIDNGFPRELAKSKCSIS